MNPYKQLGELPASFLERYNVSGPRYTSYPTAPAWTESFDHRAWQEALLKSNGVAEPDTTVLPPLSLYTHLPFCKERCLFCSCNVVITQQREQAEKYLAYLVQDIDRLSALVKPGRSVVQYHWGGGTPTYLTSEQMTRVFQQHQKHFDFHPQAEISIEVDPRVTQDEQLSTLRSLGFNRISLGVQDFDVTVQRTVNRLQSEEQTWSIIQEARRLGFSGINLDLIYGLPFQNLDSFANTVDIVLAMSPDRIALYNFAFVPWMSPHQESLPKEAMPSGPEKFQIFCLAIQRLTDAGYAYIGMDHFARQSDELAIAQRDGSLHRNFMGYTTKAGTDLLGFGVSAISSLQGYYGQNHRKLVDYYRAIDAECLPVFRGMALSAEDQHRRHLIQSILCQSYLDSDLTGPSLWQSIQPQLAILEKDGLLETTHRTVSLTPLGRLFSRNVAMLFDTYLSEQKPVFSKTL